MAIIDEVITEQHTIRRIVTVRLMPTADDMMHLARQNASDGSCHERPTRLTKGAIITFHPRPGGFALPHSISEPSQLPGILPRFPRTDLFDSLALGDGKAAVINAHTY